MSYLIANFNDSVNDPSPVAVPFSEIKGIVPVSGEKDQVRILFKHDVTDRRDFSVYAKGELSDLCSEFANAIRGGKTIDATAITQKEKFDPGVKVGELVVIH